jgi:hypothetical protein
MAFHVRNLAFADPEGNEFCVLEGPADAAS